MTHANLLGPEPTLLPDLPGPQQELDAGTDPATVAARYPSFSEAWAALAETALAEEQTVAGYAYARTGYHRGLDALRRAGWKGHGPVPWEHRPNQGFLRCLGALARAAGAIGETDEHERCRTFLADSDPKAPAAVGLA
ncbi:hypothetical protein FHR81_003740 [Actinoalloteichus hoggarensis]|uniref:Uncharacterized protein n=1 Tax=Actinoalloteichus hoggarensis TaxID=1470176 RepID=A0A221WAG2_9PSEU|nr:DUF3151 domain-containing protein [Actinoalloteichus hoggarensis]ASO23078.1 hypothetical protein AHOG_27400 [Actinoalloteichus hoggarensis]MBB5922683.1 hypothetical protein [Actinoalloteichus hoggarensis]